jgi:2-desacetyl-2-hydroxyethyl bacteriochlorophyllide A dehydrogenase
VDRPDGLRVRQLVFPERRRCVVEDGPLAAGALGPDRVLLQTEVSLMSTGTELANYSGLDPGVDVPGSWNAYPSHPGYAAVGHVVWAGERVSGLPAGRRVLAFTPHASHVVVTPAQRAVFPLEEGDDPLRVVLVRMASVACTALRLAAGAQAGRTAAVIGLGLVGNFAAQLFQLAGLRVVAFDPAPRRVEIARGCGIAGARTEVGAAAAAVVSDLTGGRGADVVIEAIGNPALIAGAVGMCARLGEVLLLGSPRGPLQGDTGPLWSAIHHRGIRIVGALEWLLPYHRREAGAGHSIEANVEALLRWVRSGELRTEGLVSHVVPPERAQETYDGVLADRNGYMGICFDWR